MANEEIESTLRELMANMSAEEKAEFVKKLYATGFQKIAAGEEVTQKNIRILNSLRNEVKRL
ncbi:MULTISPECIES: hypothetical protein [Paraburkholderia]|uniref:hypothetical protein n=1 Tax=Paraburkholderia TaxID=1822464 RepID=UPI0022588A81|nr:MULTISPECIES: hypothetical protein [Paraburkholderia]MCX4156647.1 hypothetical protein [Paraburkholderia aspalathi]MDN7166052.1 hypothetical protein [Paraburkholderia sp. SECH2]MDQ6394538.1 hypothetical protein [Paraburkholderia aspalathi]